MKAPTEQAIEDRQPTPRELPDRKTSKNAYINGSMLYTYNKYDVLCVKCGEIGHTSKECPGPVLPAWEQSYLKGLVFGDSPQVSFVSASYGAYDGASQPYGTEQVKDTGSYSATARSDSVTVGAASSSGCYSFPGSPSYPKASAGAEVAEVEAKMADTFYGEGSCSISGSKTPDFKTPDSKTSGFKTPCISASN